MVPLRWAAWLAIVGALRSPVPRRIAPSRLRRFDGGADSDGDLSRLREEIAALEADLASNKKEVVAPVRKAPALVGGRVDVAAALARLDPALLPAGADAVAEAAAFGRFCLLDEMTGAGLSQKELGGATFAAVDGNEPLILLLAGLEDVNPGDDVDAASLKAETDKFVRTLSAAVADGDDGDAAWKKLEREYDDDVVEDDVEESGDRVFGVDLEQAGAMSAAALAAKLERRFASSLADHWADWCACVDGDVDAPLLAAALEKLRPQIALSAVSSSQFAAEIAKNATRDDEAFAQRYGLFEVAFKRVLKDAGAADATERTATDYADVARALRVANFRTSRRVEVVKEVAGYFFERVTDSPARDLVLDKLKAYRLVPDDEVDPDALRDAFVDRASSYFTGAVNALNVVGALLGFGVLYALFAVVVAPLVGAVAGGVSGVVSDSSTNLDALSGFLK